MITLLQQQQQEQHNRPSRGITIDTQQDTRISRQQQVQQQQEQHDALPYNDRMMMTMMMINDEYCDPYHILHIRRDATKSEMKRSYQQLALLYHPSLTTTMNNNINTLDQKRQQQTSFCLQKQKIELFTLIAASYETLSVKETRIRMDMILQQEQQQKMKKNKVDGNGINTTTTKNNMKRTTTANILTSSQQQHNNDNKNTIIISKEERKIRQKLQQERRIQQQERREKKKNNNKNKKTKTKQEKLLSPTKQNHQLFKANSYDTMEIKSGSCSKDDGTDSSCKNRFNHPKRVIQNKIITTQQHNHNHHINNNDTTYERKRLKRKEQKRGYNWSYVSSTCGCPADTDDNNDNDIIPYDEPFDRIDKVTTTTSPVKIVQHRNGRNYYHHHKTILRTKKHTASNIPPSLVGSSDSELDDDDNYDDHDSDNPLSINNFIMNTTMYNSNNNPMMKNNNTTTTTTTTTDTERWFGGPLKLMYRARKYQPFTDPYIIFENTFHSGILSQQQQQQQSNQLKQSHQLITTDTNNNNNSTSITNPIHNSNNYNPITKNNNNNNNDVSIDPSLEQKHQHIVISPLTIATLCSRNSNVIVPISASDDIIETLQDGTIVTKTHRTRQLGTTTTTKVEQQQHQQQNELKVIHKVITRTITRYPPDSIHHHRMTINVTSDYVVTTPVHNANGISSAILLSSLSSSNHKTNYFDVDCLHWLTCTNLLSDSDYNKNDTNDYHSMTTIFQSWLPTC